MINITGKQDESVERPRKDRTQPRPPAVPRNQVIDGHDQENFQSV